MIAVSLGSVASSNGLMPKVPHHRGSADGSAQDSVPNQQSASQIQNGSVGAAAVQPVNPVSGSAAGFSDSGYNSFSEDPYKFLEQTLRPVETAQLKIAAGMISEADFSKTDNESLLKNDMLASGALTLIEAAYGEF